MRPGRVYPVLSLSQIQRRNWKRLRAAGRDFLSVQWTDAKLLLALRQLERRNDMATLSGEFARPRNGDTPRRATTIRGGLARSPRRAAWQNYRLGPTRRSWWPPWKRKKKKAKSIRAKSPRHQGQRPGLHYRSEGHFGSGLKRLGKTGKARFSGRLIDEDAALPSSATVNQAFSIAFSRHTNWLA